MSPPFPTYFRVDEHKEVGPQTLAPGLPVMPCCSLVVLAAGFFTYGATVGGLRTVSAAELEPLLALSSVNALHVVTLSLPRLIANDSCESTVIEVSMRFSLCLSLQVF